MEMSFCYSEESVAALFGTRRIRSAVAAIRTKSPTGAKPTMNKTKRRAVVGILAAAAVLALGATRAAAIQSTGYVMNPISMWGSYGGGASASVSYRISFSWTSVSGRLRNGNTNACLGFLCAMSGMRVFTPLTSNAP